jgi:class 3 adenylate cyclase
MAGQHLGSTMATMSGTDRAPSLTYGFLFADLRGYTSFLDRRGAIAASALLDRFRTLVRSAVAAHHGAEIRTEGDSFYVVFPSASMAVACALEIVRAAADDVVHDDPILVGVGVHAGEALETPEGPVGTAVNIAARLCALAGPGEVVVSDTVRALTRSVGNAGFVALGRKPIKGLDESLTLYRAVPAGTAVTPVRRRVSRVRQIAGGIAGLALVASLAFVALVRPTAPAASPSPVASASTPGTSAAVASSAPLPSLNSGVFASRNFALPFTFDTRTEFYPLDDRVDLVAVGLEDPSAIIDVVLPEAMLEPPCPTSTPTFLGGRPEDLIEWLTTRTWLDAGSPRPYNVGRYIGRAVDVEVPPSDRWTCPEGRRETAHIVHLGVPHSDEDFGATWGLDVGWPRRMIALDVDGRTVLIAVGSHEDEFTTVLTQVDPVIQTLRFEVG